VDAPREARLVLADLALDDLHGLVERDVHVVALLLRAERDAVLHDRELEHVPVLEDARRHRRLGVRVEELGQLGGLLDDALLQPFAHVHVLSNKSVLHGYPQNQIIN